MVWGFKFNLFKCRQFIINRYMEGVCIIISVSNSGNFAKQLFILSLIHIFLNVLISFLGSLWGIPISSGTYSDFTGENYLTMVLTVALLPAVFEELFFRGAVLSTLDTYGTVPAVFISSAFFVLMHGLDWFFLSTFFAGIVFAVTVKITQSVFASMIIHFLNNIMTYVLAVYASRLKAVELDKFMIYTVILAFLVGLYFIVATILKLSLIHI